jgi:hypothetical protein
MIRYRVEPRPLLKVKELHLDGVFGEFDDVVNRDIARCERSSEKIDQEKARFFKYLKQRVDRAKFGDMQEFQLSEGKLRPDSDMVKYIDPVTWFDSKLRIALRLGLDQRPPMEILDIGTGPAHFPVVAEFYGHHVLGTDLPYRSTGQLQRGHLYDALAHIYNVERIPMKVEQYVALPPLGRRFGLVTAFLAAFNLDSDRKPWTIDAWNFFFNDLRENVLTENGEVFMSLADDKLTPEVWAYLADRAVFTNPVAKQIHITDVSQFGSSGRASA